MRDTSSPLPPWAKKIRAENGVAAAVAIIKRHATERGLRTGQAVLYNLNSPRSRASSARSGQKGGADRSDLRRPGHPGSGFPWTIARIGCLALMVLVLVPFAASVPLRWRQLSNAAEPTSILGLPPAIEAAYTSRLGPPEIAAWQSLGLSVNLYAAYILSFEIALAVVCTLVGLFIFWRST